MVELSPHRDGWQVHYGGDTLNVALHLTRLGYGVSYLTALGDDPFAGRMRSSWAREGMDVSLVLNHPERTSGLYAIETDRRGERKFSYWRCESAARALYECEGVDQAEEAARGADLLFFSLISLAVLPEEGRSRLLALAADVRASGGKVAFDSNYRARLWDSPEVARIWYGKAIALADFGLPTLEDERALGTGETAEDVATHWLHSGAGEVVVKMGERGCLLPDGSVLPPPMQFVPLDTSGAGDAFDAGYLGARLRGDCPERAAVVAHKLAGWTVMRQGAIPPRDYAAPYADLTEADG
jgi:2-dehydro-3-deoxygluconokinase